MILDVVARLIFGEKMNRADVEDMTVTDLLFYNLLRNDYIKKQNELNAR